ncbi:MAG: TonB-dependent receptor, partial [Bacteroidetes bacterium]|nr:TonB-dependent receptor [Bacteroidota bacterium]
NLKRVVSRGATLELKMQNKPDMNTKGFVARGGLSYSYTNTISLDSSSANDKSRGKQLIYVPLHNLSTSIRLQYRRFYVQVSQSYTGLRFITTDDSQALKPYYLLHLEVGKDIYLKTQRLGLAFRINNITNQEYQLVSQRPMPGRSFEGILRIKLSK